MKQMIKIIRKIDIEKEQLRMFEAELDYELATLYDAMQQEDEEQKIKSKHRLAELVPEINALKASVKANKSKNKK